MLQTLPNSGPVTAHNYEAKEQVCSSKIHSLVGLKFFLILAVVFNHGRIFFASWQKIECPLNLSLAVSCFFVLSGFLLSFGKSVPLDRRNLLTFYLKRITRIWPGHAFSLILLVALLPNDFPITNGDTKIFLANLMLVQAWIPEARYFFSYNSPAWSMSTLLFFYLCFPFLSAVTRSRYRHFLLPISFSIVLAIAWISNSVGLPDVSSSSFCIKGLMYVSPLTRLLEFIAGMILCEFFKNKIGDWRPKIKMATSFEIVAILIFFGISAKCDYFVYSIAPYVIPEITVWLQYCGLSLIPILLLVLALSFQTGLVSKFLSKKPIVFLGEISFGIYLLHMVVLHYLHHKLPNLSSFSASWLFICVLLLGAYLIYTLVENPIRQMVLAKTRKSK